MVALCQFLPGPASSQLGMAIGYDQKSTLGTLTAWLAFTLPSAVLMLFFAYGLQSISETNISPIIHGLKVAACVIVAHALFTMGTKICNDKTTTALALFSCLTVMVFPGYLGQIGAIVICAVLGMFLIKTQDNVRRTTPFKIQKRSIIYLCLFFLGLFGLPILSGFTDNETVALLEKFYRAGALVFGGGHVVLPLLEADFVQTSLLSKQEFLSGYGAAQALPGPMFAISSFIGALSTENLITGTLIGIVGIFIPSLILVLAVFPIWSHIRSIHWFSPAITAINAAVVGLLLATFYNPVITSSVLTPLDFLIVCSGIALITRWNTSAFVIVIYCVIMNTLICNITV